jgi:hypothetical protein
VATCAIGFHYGFDASVVRENGIVACWVIVLILHQIVTAANQTNKKK